MKTELIHVMIAEDFDLLREDLSELINEQEDMIVVGSVSTGKEVENLVKEKEVAIILMDIEMENITAGIQAAEEILRIKPQIKIIYLSAHETKEMLITAMATGAVDYIVKGISNEKILEHIRCAYQDQPLLESKIQKTIMEEFSRLKTSEQSLLFFIHTLSKLTPTEKELVKLLLENKKIKEIADLRCVEIVTVKTQIKSLLRKFDCNRTKEIIHYIRQLKVEHLF